MQKYIGFLVVVSFVSFTLVFLVWSGFAEAHKTGNEIRHFKTCKVLASKKKYRKCLKCLKGKGKGGMHFHSDRLFQRCMPDGKIPFFRSGPPS